MNQLAKKAWPDALVVALFLLLSFAYFASPLSQGMVLGGHDTVASIGQGHEQTDFTARTGETSRWTNAMFSGMPTYQISPSYGPTKVLSKVAWVIGLFTSGPLNYVFMYLIGFYILMRAFGFRPLLSAFGAVAWAFSSYFFIIIAAGHIWKVNTLAFIPPTIAGLVLCYRGRLLWGGAVTALFTALQVLSNHIQMTYYFLFVMALIVVACGIAAFLRGNNGAEIGGEGKTLRGNSSNSCPDFFLTPRRWLKATGVIVVAGLIGALVNLPNLYHTWQYSKESMRGKAELTQPASDHADAPTEGLDRDYITAWSYGIDETLTLMIPNFKGGGSQSIMDRDDATELDGYTDFYEHAAGLQQALQESNQQGMLPGLMQYWGDQPFTVGPVYVGAIVCFLFMLGLFIVRGPLKWALLASTVVSLLFAWGHNIMPVADFFIDHLPMYNKFRTVSSALVIAEFTMPLLAMLALAAILRQPELMLTRRGKVGFSVAGVLTAGVCLLFAVAPSAANCLSANDAQTFVALQQAGLPADFVEGYRKAVLAMHHDILSADAMRSLLLICAAVGLIVLYCKRRIKGWIMVGALLVLCLADMWTVNKRYLNEGSFADPVAQLEGFSKTPADERILQDKDLSYRVLNLSQGNPFNETSNQTSFWHKSIGGYHAAKLHRYQDLIDRKLAAECNALASAVNKKQDELLQDTVALRQKAFASTNEFTDYVMAEVRPDSIIPVLNMLNMRYAIMAGGKLAIKNAAANGNGWFVKRLNFADGADAEMAGLNGLDTKRAAVADAKFRATLDGSALGTGTVRLTSYAPNEVHYDVESQQGGVVVFSEIYYPGWTATIDGKPAEVGRVNYVLRALKVPAGSHKVVMEFRPASVATTDAIAYAALALVVAGFVLAMARQWRKRRQAE